eukprot:5941328-Amphidinium_carterae.1
MLVDVASRKLGMQRTGDETLLYGTEVVPINVSAEVHTWPGSPSLGALTEYQLVKSKRARLE